MNPFAICKAPNMTMAEKNSSLFEEKKNSLPLKKKKNLSEKIG